MVFLHVLTNSTRCQISLSVPPSLLWRLCFSLLLTTDLGMAAGVPAITPKYKERALHNPLCFFCHKSKSPQKDLQPNDTYMSQLWDTGSILIYRDLRISIVWLLREYIRKDICRRDWRLSAVSPKQLCPLCCVTKAGK